jgi:hypothetical protein
MRCARALPIPPAPPVTMTVFPRSCIAISDLFELAYAQEKGL